MLIAIDFGEKEAVCLSQQKYCNSLYGQVLLLRVSYLMTQILMKVSYLMTHVLVTVCYLMTQVLLCCTRSHGHQHQAYILNGLLSVLYRLLLKHRNTVTIITCYFPGVCKPQQELQILVSSKLHLSAFPCD